MLVSAPVRVNGREVYAVVGEGRGGRLMLRFGLDDWDGLGLPRGRRVRLLHDGGDRWYVVDAILRMEDAPAQAWVTFLPTESPAEPRRRGAVHGVRVGNYRLGA